MLKLNNMTSGELKNKLQKSLDFLSIELSQIRTGRATPSLVEDIRVEVYGSKMAVKELGSISLLDPQNILISPWDKSVATAISAAVRDSDLKVNPIVDGASVRVPIPALTEERRKEFAKIASGKVEEAKNAMRSIRQEAMKDVDKDFADKKIGEDEKFSLREAVEETVKDYIEKADEMGNSKKDDLLKI
jgi:ribosome recycling factor